jgi:hypothetical protein
MAKKIISYKLNTDGTVPDFVENGGYLPKDVNDTLNMVLLGVSKDGVDTSGAFAGFATEADVLAYVNTYLSDTTTTEPGTDKERTFVVADAVSNLFAKLS